MTPARIHALLATTAVIAVLVHGLAGHGLPQMSGDDMAGAAAGFCLLLATVVASAATPRAERRPRMVVADKARAYVAASPTMSPDGRARASPSALQRFRN